MKTPLMNDLHEALSGKKVVLLSDWLTVPGGAEEVVRQMLEVTPATVIAAQLNPEKFPWLAQYEHRTTWVSKAPLGTSKHYVYAPILADVYRGIDLREFDVVLCSSHTFGHHVKRARPDAKVYVYYHSPARAAWLPEIDKRAGQGFLRSLVVQRIKKLDLEICGRPNRISANSQTTADRIKRFYNREVDRVVYPGVDVNKFAHTQRSGPGNGYVMWGRLIEYKRVDLAIEAAKIMGFDLHIVGKGPMEASLQELAKGHANVKFHGRLSDEGLQQLLATSRAFLFPAYEDFGIVAVESLSAGLPVVAFSAGGAAESVTPDCGVHIHEQTVEALCEGIKALESREFDPLVLKAQAQRFSIDRFKQEYAEEVLALLRS